MDRAITDDDMSALDFESRGTQNLLTNTRKKPTEDPRILSLFTARHCPFLRIQLAQF
jgi:hypothetical protein